VIEQGTAQPEDHAQAGADEQVVGGEPRGAEDESHGDDRQAHQRQQA
jgi:hypothetical protein